MYKSETELVTRAKRGDQEAKALLVRDYERMVYNLGLRLLGNREEAECVLQDTFLKILESLDTFKGNSQLSTWIYRIAANQALMRLRSRKKRYVPLIADKEDEEVNYSNIIQSFDANPLQHLLNSELKENMLSAIELLSPKYKSAFILKDIEGLSLKEIGEILNLSVPAVKSNVHRARLFLREKLSEFIDGKERN